MNDNRNDFLPTQFTTTELDRNRPTSAPPNLEFSTDSLFAFRTDFAQHFADIRLDDSYPAYYEAYGDTAKLPPPLDAYPLGVGIDSKDIDAALNEELRQQEFNLQSKIMPSAMNHFNPNAPRAEEVPIGLPANGHGSVWSPLPRRFSKFSLEDSVGSMGSIDESHLVPDLSDSEAFSSTDDVASLMDNIQERLSLSQMENTPPTVRYLWDDDEKGLKHPSFPTQQHGKQPVVHSYGIGSTQRSPRNHLQTPQLFTSMHQDAAHQLGSITMRTVSPSPSAIGRPISPNPLPMRPISPAAPVRPVSPVPGMTLPEPPPGFPGLVDYPALGNTPYFSLEALALQQLGVGSAVKPPASVSPVPGAPLSLEGDRNGAAGSKSVTKSHSTSPPTDHGNANAAAPASRKHEIARLTSIDQVIGQVYSLCKDQHGCRFLQRKLEENNARITEIIFNEVYPHIVELMTDPFGNYLCQKLLEYCNDKQRLSIVERVAGDLVTISKNMHGTRAVQKMIEYLNSPTQIQIVINALRSSVVALIQDLNGNHVIQRFLNKLSAEDNQFVYDAVAGHCVAVATHRHGCCVLQRCIDHAADRQKIQLVKEITSNALTLVQDPYGNYVVQYVLDLPYLGVASALIKKFSGHLSQLSMQKFSSNVIEKCLNVADQATRRWMVEEFLESEILGTLLQDPFANYVIQTALTISDPEQHVRLVEAIKPHLPALRNTPYGKRIQNKIMKESIPPAAPHHHYPQGHHRT
eukprot:TRINITY_DN445_c0_g1_i2.p1 TRINITY_DN445_c0_g1~~TRINITY_DN445_c0_g1_i2.p1  ORF type:complete len:746 (-),score=122.39 TRINITY_DN445_c0_g1_i2:341-2578(-)